ncbi:MAG: glycosyltransferase family 1 protein [Nitrospirota bacterium]
MKKTVLLDLGKLKDLHCGLGQVSLQLGKKVDGYDDGEMKINFLVPKDFRAAFKSESEPLSLRRRYLPFSCKRYDLWHAPHQDSAYFPSRPNTPYILTIQDLNFLEEKGQQKANWRLQRLQNKVTRASAITVASKFTEEMVRRHINLIAPRGQAIPVFTVYQGVDLPVATEEKINFPITDPFLFFVGALLEKKNLMVLIDFMKLMPNYQLVIAGKKDTEYARSLQKKVQTLGLESRILFLGRISQGEKAWLYQHCEALVFPSKYEGFGMPVLEAMGFGKPVFLSTYSSLPEIGGENAYYWNDFSPESMKERFETKMAEFKSNPHLSEKLSQYAKSYNWDRTAKEYIKIYRHLLGLLPLR